MFEVMPYSNIYIKMMLLAELWPVSVFQPSCHDPPIPEIKYFFWALRIIRTNIVCTSVD